MAIPWKTSGRLIGHSWKMHGRFHGFSMAHQWSFLYVFSMEFVILTVISPTKSFSILAKVQWYIP